MWLRSQQFLTGRLAVIMGYSNLVTALNVSDLWYISRTGVSGTRAAGITRACSYDAGYGRRRRVHWMNMGDLAHN